MSRKSELRAVRSALADLRQKLRTPQSSIISSTARLRDGVTVTIGRVTLSEKNPFVAVVRVHGVRETQKFPKIPGAERVLRLVDLLMPKLLFGAVHES